MIRLLLFTEFFPLTLDEAPSGGVEQRVLQLVQRLKNVDVTIVCSRRPGQSRISDFGSIRVVRVGPSYPYSNNGHVLKRILFALSAIWHGLRSQKPDVIEGSSFLGYVPAALVARIRRVRSIVTYHECWLGRWIRIKGISTGLFGEAWERLALAIGFDTVIAVSASTQSDLMRHNVRNIVVVPNGVAMTAFKKTPRGKKPTVTFVGRLVAGKHVDILIRAVGTLRPQPRLVVIGDGPERQRLESLAKEIGVNATFTGFVKSTDDVRAMVSSSHVFCLPSSIEGFGISVIEAMACDVPVVVADIPPLREIVDNGKVGLLVPVGDVKSTADAIRTVLTKPGVSAMLRRQGRLRLKEYDWEIIARRYSGIVTEPNVRNP